MAASASLSCPLCCHNSQRYEHVEENCKTVSGFNAIQNVIQHLIKCHLHICRRCKQEFRPGSPVKSQTQYKKMLSECTQHKSCAECPWPAGKEYKTPEILDKVQQEVVLSWSQSEAVRRLSGGDPGAPTRDSELWVDLYRQLFPGEDPDPRWKYWIAHHQMAAKERAWESEEKNLKRKLSSQERELEDMRRQLAEAKQQLRDQTVHGVWSPSQPTPAVAAEDREFLLLPQGILTEIGMARMGSNRGQNTTAAGTKTIDPNRLQLYPPRSQDDSRVDNLKASLSEVTSTDPWGDFSDSGFESAEKPGDGFAYENS